MERPQVIAQKNRYTPLLWWLQPGALAWLLMDRFGAPAWGYGVLWALLAVTALGSAINFFRQVERTPKWEETTP